MGLSYDLQAFFEYITYTKMMFNKVSEYVKKFDGVAQEIQYKMLSKKSHNVGNFSGSYSKSHDQQDYLACHI